MADANQTVAQGSPNTANISFPLAIVFSVFALSFSTQTLFAQQTYREPFRPLYHFTPPKNWMNDPNGMVYFEEEWHLFYQYNPFGDKWGHMSWGHAVSRDLIHWEHLPLALPEANGIMIFSGSAVVDWKNTTGFGKDGKPPLIAIYTGHREGRQDQRIAYSNDKGRTWNNYSENPVLDVKMADFRDPKVFWHELTGRWVMTVALAAEKKVHFYTSPNLKTWKYVGEFGPAGATGGLWECPDLFPLPVDGAGAGAGVGGGKKWVLIININPGGPAGGSGCQYFVGEFDGNRFIADPLPTAKAEWIPEGKILADFEKGYGDWKADGDAFGTAPAPGTLPNQMPVTGFKGKGLVNSFFSGDQSTGTLTSPPFEISAGYLSFLIGGGAHPDTRVDLLVEGKAVRTARGQEMERLTWKSWDVRDLSGKTAQIQVIDKHKGGWGHINFDHPILADAPARAASEEALWADYGSDFYAGVSWSDVPQKDGRRIWLGWMSNWNYANDVPTAPWRSGFSIPREMRLRKTSDGYRLTQLPVAEISKLRLPRQSADAATIESVNQWIQGRGLKSGPMEIAFTLIGKSDEVEGIRIFEGKGQATVIGVNRKKGELFVDRTKSGLTNFHPKFANIQVAPLSAKNQPIKLRILVDIGSVEVFANDGEQVITSLIFPSDSGRDIRFFGDPATTRIDHLEVGDLKSIWK